MSDIITYILGYLMPKLVVQKYRRYVENKRFLVTEDGNVVSANYKVIGTATRQHKPLLIEVLEFSNDKVKSCLDFSLFDVTNEEFFSKFEYLIDGLITYDDPYYSAYAQLLITF